MFESSTDSRTCACEEQRGNSVLTIPLQPHTPTAQTLLLSALQRRKESLGQVPQKQAPCQGRGGSGFFGDDSGEHQEGDGLAGDGQCGCEGGQGCGQLGPAGGVLRAGTSPGPTELGYFFHPHQLSWLKLAPRKNYSSALPACPTGQGAIPQPEGERCWQPETTPRAGNHRPGGGRGCGWALTAPLHCPDLPKVPLLVSRTIKTSS